MGEFYLEDCKVGDRFQTASHTITKSEIIAFAREFDPQPFHLDEEAASRSVFRGLAASGWHTAAIAMKLYVTSGLKLAGGSVGFAVDELRWPIPVRPGDTLQSEIEVIGTRPSQSKKNRGVIRIRTTTKNQRGHAVQTFVASVLVHRRP